MAPEYPRCGEMDDGRVLSEDYIKQGEEESLWIPGMIVMSDGSSGKGSRRRTLGGYLYKFGDQFVDEDKITHFNTTEFFDWRQGEPEKDE